MKPGDLFARRTITVAAQPMHVIATVLRDSNPIHLDPAAAEAAGLGNRVINQGPANMAYVVDTLLSALPGYRITELQSSFLSSVRAGDVVEVRGVARAVTASSVTCDATLKLSDGTVAMQVGATLSKLASNRAHWIDAAPSLLTTERTVDNIR